MLLFLTFADKYGNTSYLPQFGMIVLVLVTSVDINLTYSLVQAPIGLDIVMQGKILSP